jgi:hypothetical protein
MKSKYIIACIMLLLLPIVFAEQQTLGTFKKGDCITLRQNCANCTFVNFTSVYQTGTDAKFLINDSLEATKNNNIFTYYLCNITPENAEYHVDGIGDVYGDGEVCEDCNFAYNYFVTSEGYSSNSWIIMLIVFIFIWVLIVFSAWKEEVWLFAIGALGMNVLGIYVHINGLGDIKNFVTDMFALVNWAIGGIMFLVSMAQEAMDQLGG